MGYASIQPHVYAVSNQFTVQISHCFPKAVAVVFCFSVTLWLLQVWSKVCISNMVHTWCSVERGNKLLLLTRKWLHWLYIEPWRSVVKVEPWNMIRACRNLQLQIVWNWLGVMVLFGRHAAIGSIYLLRTTKVSGNTERGSRMVIFLLFTFFCVLHSLFVEVSEAGTHIRGSLKDFRVYFWWCYDDGQNFWQTPKFQVISPLPRSSLRPSVDSNEFDGCF